jgi:uncharacterized membrane protein YeaQ/YmgE (transglycosylase-associated protein family)
MVLVNCLWVGVLAGMVGSRLIRGRSGFVSPSSSVAVGLLGGVVGLVADGWLGHGAARLPNGDILAAGAGATLALGVWAVAQRAFATHSHTDSGS